MTKVVVKNLHKKFGDVVAVDGIDLQVSTGELVTLLGPSGCGKTTTLRCIAGLEEADDGEIIIGDTMVSGKDVFIPPEIRNIGMVFQSYAIWPHMRVYDNVSYGLTYGLTNKDLDPQEIKRRTLEALKLVKLEELENRYATDLSGGQQQRVALARSIASDPKVLLFDEPLSNLDAKLREEMRFELRSLHQKLGKTSIYVTHDQLEAMAISDRIILMNEGKILAVGTAVDLYDKPPNKFTAEFIGSCNFLTGKVIKVADKDDLGTIETENGIKINCQLPSHVKEGSRVTFAIRPERICLFEKKIENANVFLGVVDRSIFYGDFVDIYIRLQDETTILRVKGSCLDRHNTGKTIYLQLDSDDLVFIG